jgi:hypothetical protein
MYISVKYTYWYRLKFYFTNFSLSLLIWHYSLNHNNLSVANLVTSTLSLANCTTAVYKKDNGTCACGFFLERGLYWRQAADRCYALGARLPEIKSLRENQDIYALMVYYFLA